MKRLFKLGIACLVGVAFAAMAMKLIPASAGGNEGAALYLPTKQIDLGIVKPREDHRVRFPVMNMSNRRLVINELDDGCRCGKPVRETILLAPGDTVEITIDLDTGFTTGPIEKTFRFATSDPMNPRFNLTVYACNDPGESAISMIEEQASVSVLVRE